MDSIQLYVCINAIYTNISTATASTNVNAKINRILS